MFSFPDQSTNLENALSKAWPASVKARAEFLTPEDLLWGIAWQRQFMMVTGDAKVSHTLTEYFREYPCSVPDGLPYEAPLPSEQFIEMTNMAYSVKAASGAKRLDVPHILQAIFNLQNSFAHDVLMAACDGNVAEFMSSIIEYYDDPVLDYDGADEADFLFQYDDIDPQPSNDKWLEYVTCLNETVDSHNPLIGREKELERTILVLCRKDKNNPMHVGEAGVGKTAIAYGLAARINSGDVPDRLKGCRIYQLDLGALIAGTQYRGEFEKRLKLVLKGVEQQGRAILYLDEVHTIIGAGQVEGGALDASNMLKPYLERGEIRFIGATTYDEYKRVVRNKAFSRRFEKIDIDEPSVEQCKLILHGLKDNYERFHNVKFSDEAIDFAVDASAKYISGRFLPDKAIDLVDEAGAWAHIKYGDSVAVVDKKLVSDVLARTCNVDMLAQEAVDVKVLGSLKQRILEQIYGQDKAVSDVSEAVEMASAGLTDENKPMASLLFVGPTGVGKTEVARVLARELHLPLLRFDMSEYAEKHTVAKLIGAPAGYVGYDDGGLLTDAIRKQPHCVLLFDEIEKAHTDIYNILLQVMDYAVLTDNKGQKADFRHVVLIMTTNAGAQGARQAAVGFHNTRQRSDAMLKSVKLTFKPEFINRLTAITLFNDIDQHMASLILDKKLAQLQQMLTAKGVTLDLSPAARDLLMREGFSPEYGGREVERVINSRLKPLLMRAILYGSLQSGGIATIIADGDQLKIKGKV